MVRYAKSLLAVCFTVAMLGAVSCSTAGSSTGVTAPAVDGNTRLIYDVRDLVIPKQPDAEPFLALPRLTVALKEATCDAGGWERRGWQIEAQDPGYLVVDASQDMQEKVAMVLSDLRRFAVAKQ